MNYLQSAGSDSRGQASFVNEDSNFGGTPLVTYETALKIMSTPRPESVLALYTFYAIRAVQQKTQQIWCTTGYVAKGLGWGEEKVKKTKKKLKDLGLIEDIKAVSVNGKFTKPYIRVRFIDRSAYFPPSGEIRPAEKKPTTAPRGKESAPRGKEKYSHSSSTHSLERVKVVENENQARIINLYHRKLCGPGSDFLPITELSPELRKVLEVFENTDNKSLTEIFEDAKRYHERTLVRILWDNY